jgi:hypothetical protein
VINKSQPIIQPEKKETRSLVTRSIVQNRFKRNFPTAKRGRRGSHERDHLGEPREMIGAD